MIEWDDLFWLFCSVIDMELNDVDGGYDDEDYDGMVVFEK